MKMEYVLKLPNLRRVRHSRMFLAGIQADFGLDPRLKHSGATVLGGASFDPSQIFEGAHESIRRVRSVHRNRDLSAEPVPTS